MAPLCYIENRSCLLDLKILGLTKHTVLRLKIYQPKMIPPVAFFGSNDPPSLDHMPPMQIQREHIENIVFETLRELGEDLERPELLQADGSTRLFGARSALDSINLVNLIADVEERVYDDFGVKIILANNSAMSRTHSPFRRVDTCVDYIMELINNEES
jgi:hypothetical protein